LTDSHTRPGRLEVLEANARHATDRYRLYRARVSGPHPTSPGRLRELEREAKLAKMTLARAQTTTMNKENDAIDRH
jgi:hypothetical protein